MAKTFLSVDLSKPLPLPAQDGAKPSGHVFDQASVDALDAAIASERPLLIRGEPGTGKSQLALAAAVALGRVYLPFTVDARTEARDLLYTVDTVARLAEAQIAGHLPNPERRDVREGLAEANFTAPGPLWWAFDWHGASRQAEKSKAPMPSTETGSPENGAVLLIDEIDKSDPSVPNGLLEALGLGRFPTPWNETVSSRAKVPPLVVITTNEERSLPDAFLRRCLVLQLSWPLDRAELIAAFVARGKAHFQRAPRKLLELAAEMVADDREVVASRGLCPPGGAEYLDLLRAVWDRWPRDTGRQIEGLERIRTFVLRKHPRDSET